MPTLFISVAVVFPVLTSTSSSALYFYVDREPQNLPDFANCLRVDGVGNVYVAGYSYSSRTAYDYVTIKYDTDGNMIWISRYNGPANGLDYVRALQVDTQENVYVTGHSEGKTSSADYATVKYDSRGNRIWVARYDGPTQRYDSAQALAVDSDSNVYVTGYSRGSGTGFDYATVKYDPNGRLLWTTRYNGDGIGPDFSYAIAVTPSGHIVITGCSRSNISSYDSVTIQYNSSGKQLWASRYHGPERSFDYTRALGVDPSGNICVTGHSYGNGPSFDYITMKYDPKGRRLWLVSHDGPISREDEANDLVIDSAGNICITGSLYVEGPNSDYGTLKYNPSGELLWEARYNGPASGADVACAIAVDPSSNVIVTGYSRGQQTGYDFATIKYDPSGRRMWIARYDGPSQRDDIPQALAVDTAGNIFITGYSYDTGRDFDFVTVKYDPNGKLLWMARYDSSEGFSGR